ncbi:MAG TPA: helix-turn-helix transcriptional regulator [Candidatus Limnocylindrales bacterium]|nr:helix-turn-helix transcriptional regulator [Candidatus Limnocylindrales bacterium]
MQTTAPRRSLANEDRGLARHIGMRLREARLRAGLTQREVAEGRYTKAYVSALENGLIKPSVAALNFLAARLGTSASALLADPDVGLQRIEADVRLAAGEWQQAADVYRTLLDRAADERNRAELQLGLAEALGRQGKARESLALAVEAASRFERLGHRREQAVARYWVASAHHQAGNAEEALQILGDLLGEVRGGLDVAPDFEVRILVAMAMAETHNGRAERALAHLTEAKAQAGSLDDRRRATFLFSLALGYRRSGDLEAATRAGLESLGLFRAAEAATEAASISNELALIYLSLGNTERAREFAATARAAFEGTGDRRWFAHVLETEARIELATGNPSEARSRAVEAIEAANGTDNRRALLEAHLTAARASRDLGDSPSAHDHFRAAADLARADGDASRRDVFSEWGDLLAAEGDVKGAYELAREALKGATG